MGVFYYPDQKTHFEPAKLDLFPTDVYFSDERKRKIHAWHFPSTTGSTSSQLVFFHGNAQNLTSHFIMLSWLSHRGVSVFVFDYPGYGRSQGHPSPQSTVEAGQAAVRYVSKQTPDSKLPLFVYGQSLGGNIAVKVVNLLRQELQIRGLIVEASFDSYQGAARSTLSQHWLTWIFQPITYLLVSDRYAGQISDVAPVPLLIMHGDQDRVVDFRLGQELYEKATEPKKFVRVANGGHGNTYFIDRGKYREVLMEFLETPAASQL